MVKRKFSAERLYRLIRNLFILMSTLGIIASATTLYLAKSAPLKLKKIDMAIEFPREYKGLTFSSADDFLKRLYPSHELILELESKKLIRFLKIKSFFNIETETDQTISYEEFYQMVKLPDGFDDVWSVKEYRDELHVRMDMYPEVPLALLVFAVSLQIVFWGIVLLYRYLFPIAKTLNE